MSDIFTQEYTEGKDNEGYYIPQEKINTFIHQIIGEYDNSFEGIVVYGTENYPLFILRDIRNILGIPRKTVEDNIKKFREHEVLQNCKVIVKSTRNGKEYLQKQQNTYMLTKFGLYHLMFISNKPIVHPFQDFVSIVLHKLEQDKIVELEEARELLKVSLDKVTKDRDELLVTNHFMKKEFDTLLPLKDMCADKEDFGMDGNPEYKTLLYCREFHCHKIPLYIVRDSYVNSKYIKKATASTSAIKKVSKKKSGKGPTNTSELESMLDLDCESDLQLESESQSDFEMITYEIPFDELPTEMQYNKDTEFYFHIPPFKSKAEKAPETYMRIGFLHVENKEHLDYIKKTMNDDKPSVTKIKDVFATTHETIYSVLNTWLSNKLHSTIYGK